VTLTTAMQFAVGATVDTCLGPVILRGLLGKGKSGYSWRVDHSDGPMVLKLMHNEPCPYYDFGDRSKVALEVAAFHRLTEVGVEIPLLLGQSEAEGYLLKEFVDGEVATQRVMSGIPDDQLLAPLFALHRRCQAAAINLDWFPDNFVIQGDRLIYVDYEFNPYTSDWNLPNWGLYYWLNGQGMRAFKASGDSRYINRDRDSGVPIREPFAEQAAHIIGLYHGS